MNPILNSLNLTEFVHFLMMLLLGTQYAVPSNAASKTLTGHATAHTYGSWVEIDASTARELMISNVLITACTGVHQIEIGVGASGSEVGIGVTLASAVGYAPFAHAPSAIPAGSRLVARTATTAGTTQTCAIRLLGRSR